MISRRAIRMVTDSYAPGLMLYGLHNDLASDTDDSDYKPPRWKPDDSDDSDNSLSNGSNDESKRKKKKKIKGKAKMEKGRRRQKRLRPFADDAHQKSDDSEDEDYVPNSPEKKVIKKQKKNIKQQAKEAKLIRVLDIKAPECSSNQEENKKRTNDSWTVLPVEILSRIFRLLTSSDDKGVRYLCRCTRVCKHWRRVAEEPVSWFDVDVSFVGPSLSKKQTLNIISQLTERRLQEVRSLNMSGWCALTDDGLLKVANSCPKLQRIDISSCQKKSVSKLTSASLSPLANNCPSLTHINASNLRIAINYSKTLSEFIDIRGQDLVHLNFSSNVAFSTAALNCIVQNCPQLVYLDCSNTSVRVISLKELQQNCPLIKELYLANLGLDIREKRNDLKTCPGFEHLEVASFASPPTYSWVTNNVLYSMLKRATKLTTLDVRGCKLLIDVDMQISSDAVQRLYLSQCTISMEFVENLCARWSETLWDLDLGKVMLSGDSISSFLRRLLNGTDPCQHLVHLNLNSTCVCNEDVLFILEKCKELETLDLTSCKTLSRGLKRLYSSKQDLEELSKICQGLCA